MKMSTGHPPIWPPVGLLSAGAPAKVSFRRQSNAHRHAAQVVSTQSITPAKEVSSFEPSVWGDFFINYDTKPLQRSEDWMMEKADKLKQDVRILFETHNDTAKKMHLVDAVQRLGIDHLFQDEINNVISDIKESEFTSSSLHEVALHFRLLREHGIWVSPDVFEKFKGEDGRFINTIADEPRALLSLYNAAHLLVHDEPELEEAMSFARHHLESMRDGSRLKAPLDNQINRALHLPLPRTYKRVEMLHYMLEYGQEEECIVVLLDLAKLEFNLLQHVHLKELKAFSQWWKDLYGYVELSHVRDRAVESYLWSYALFYEENLTLTRMILAKIIVFIVLMDDTYDDHATIEECRKLNEAIQRWDESAISLLPEYMKKFYRALQNYFRETEAQVEASDKYRVTCMKKEFQNLSTYYLQEFEWLHQNYKPAFKERVALSTLSSTVPLLCVTAAVGQGDAVTKESFELTTVRSSAVIACAKIMRFMNDIAAFKSGRKNKGDAANTVECYMNENKVTSEVALDKIESMIESEWRTLNQVRCDHHQQFPVVQRLLNLAVSVPFFYDKKKDAYTFSRYIQEIVGDLFVNPVPI
ncbi:Os04g0341500 [Oryza sativa Japonica Group]|uniref:Os04g0341500 protein n=1 Tax=Oryza sativa subsp. japonica TaxID=39947 RepID=C7J195_ORYSJ|nr:Os04g0341500 [Oryza sativa Japonica Group]|eukprot:NP_001173880.1 Os04g0341500 [Oryza sativa Japonica Group]